MRRDLGIVRMLLGKGGKLSKSQETELQVIENLYEHQKYMYENHVHSVKDWIVNLRQPYLHPIVRGKAKTPVEFGAKLDISVVNGMCLQRKRTAGDGDRKLSTIRLLSREGLGQQNLSEPEESWLLQRTWHTFVRPTLGRPKKGVILDKKAEYEDICDRVEVECSFSLGKRKFSRGQICTYLQSATQTVIALSILALNLSQVLRAPILKMVHISWLLFDLVYNHQLFQQSCP